MSEDNYTSRVPSAPVGSKINVRQQQEKANKFRAKALNEAAAAGAPVPYAVQQKGPLGLGVPPPLDDCHISGRSSAGLEKHPKLDEGVVRIYENDLEVKRYAAKRGGGLRGTIKDFTDGSRGRMTKRLNRLHWPPGICYFVGLTFPDDFPSPQSAKRCFRAILKRIKRHWPQFENLWRQEWKRRKSGRHAGEVAPHFHFFAWGISSEQAKFFEWLQDAWTEVAGAADPVNHRLHGCDVKQVYDRKTAVWYISKYMSKSENDAQIEGGRAWGYSSGLDFSPVATIRLTLVQLACLRQIVEAYLLREGSSFWQRIVQYPEWLGWHVYGITETEVRAMIEQALQMAHLSARQGVLRIRLEGTGREYFEQARTAETLGNQAFWAGTSV